MVSQTRAVLDAYAGAGGSYREVALERSGHGPHLDQPEAFRAALLEHLSDGAA
jgi:pimeloyl-ACP methyl ester carboxylesterase